MNDSGFSNRTDAIVDLIRRGSGQPASVPAVRGNPATNVIQLPEGGYVLKSDLQELESDLYARLADQLNAVITQRLAPLEQGASEPQERERLLGGFVA